MKHWHNIETQGDINLLMDTYGAFHDSCIITVNFQSGNFVDDTGAMHHGSPDDHRLSVVFQRQWNPKTLELMFIGLRQMHLAGWQDNYFCEIFDAYLSFHDHLLPGEPHNVIVWADNGGFDVTKVENAICEPSDTYIVANALTWRIYS